MGQGWGSRARVRAGRRVESRGQGWAEVGGVGWFDVAVCDVVGVQVLHDVRQPVDDELALIPLQRALLEVVGERERAILEHHAVLLTVRVLIVVDELDDVLGAQLLEEGDLAHEVLLGSHELECDPSLRLHVERELDQVEAAHGGALLELVPGEDEGWAGEGWAGVGGQRQGPGWSPRACTALGRGRRSSTCQCPRRASRRWLPRASCAGRAR